MLIYFWHSLLDMPQKGIEWHQNDIAEELQELSEAKGIIHHWSELSDVAYTYTRAKWSGHKVKRPINLFLLNIGFIYMIPKYTLRWCFYYSIGKKFDKKLKITEVRNPKKIEKLHKIAKRYNLDTDKFQNECARLAKFWIFLP